MHGTNVMALIFLQILRHAISARFSSVGHIGGSVSNSFQGDRQKLLTALKKVRRRVANLHAIPEAIHETNYKNSTEKNVARHQ